MAPSLRACSWGDYGRPRLPVRADGTVLQLPHGAERARLRVIIVDMRGRHKISRHRRAPARLLPAHRPRPSSWPLHTNAGWASLSCFGGFLSSWKHQQHGGGRCARKDRWWWWWISLRAEEICGDIISICSILYLLSFSFILDNENSGFVFLIPIAYIYSSFILASAA